VARSTLTDPFSHRVCHYVADNGIVLPGVTRESIITLLNDHASGKQAFLSRACPRTSVLSSATFR
jgi:hypothetical protein